MYTISLYRVGDQGLFPVSISSVSTEESSDLNVVFCAKRTGVILAQVACRKRVLCPLESMAVGEEVLYVVRPI